MSTVVDGIVPPDTQAKADLYIQKWEEDLKPKGEDIKARLDEQS